MNPIGLIYILYVHWLADFVFQSDWMAKNKSSDYKALTVHISTYFVIMTLLTASWPFAALNAGLHGIIDFFTSRINKKLWDEGDVHGFFECIGFDQFLHVAILIYTYSIFKPVSWGF